MTQVDDRDYRQRGHAYPEIPQGAALYDGPGGHFLYRPGELLVLQRDADLVAERLGGRARRRDLVDERVVALGGDFDPVRTVRELRGDAVDGRMLQVAPRHLLHFEGHVAWAPARPPRPARPPARVIRGQALRQVRVGVLDTGLALDDNGEPAVGLADRCEWDPSSDDEQTDADLDGRLDAEAGHGTFIAGLVAQHAPDAVVVVQRLDDQLGCVDEVAAARAIRDLVVRREVDVLNLSFGGYTMDNLGALAVTSALDDAFDARPDLVVVAAAGNDATDRPMFPAALKRVVAVAALDGEGLADFSNSGWWVDACAPGVDAHSNFLEWSGPLAGPHGRVISNAGALDQQDFREGALWSGTSFAAPRLAAAVAVLMGRGSDGPTAVFELVHKAGLPKLPGAGTVVALP